MYMSDATQMKLAKDISGRFTRSQYEEFLIERGLHTRDDLREYPTMVSNVKFFMMTLDRFDKSDLQVILEELRARRSGLSYETVRAMVEDCVDFDEPMTGKFAELASEYGCLDNTALEKQDADIKQTGPKTSSYSRMNTDRTVSDADQLRAELQGVESTLEALEAKFVSGDIETGQYFRLKTEYETKKAKLEQKLKPAHG